MATLFNTLFYSCKKATELIDRSEHESLSLMQKIRLYFHKLLCPPCECYAKSIPTIESFLKNTKPLNPKEMEELKKQIIGKLK
ncbi:MAG: hypothetical protein A3K10_01410 [Bacteroidetes bacterium RIFCSPLOWO2_12_FULL_31_6]|nr:MAG: hypothetical protein A3K10_01410 [Bacteroidetes bacterium RIFCSPLOWO2_12_FULL_31_6]